MPREGKGEGRRDRNKDRRSGGGRHDDRDVLASKKLSFFLRHAALREGLKMDERGFVNVGDLVSFLPTYSVLPFFLFFHSGVLLRFHDGGGDNGDEKEGLCIQYIWYLDRILNSEGHRCILTSFPIVFLI
jgi:hypothetical protein